jgi:hypothetical protein
VTQAERSVDAQPHANRAIGAGKFAELGRKLRHTGTVGHTSISDTGKTANGDGLDAGTVCGSVPP